MFDEVAIRKQVEWDGKKFAGYVDAGAGIDSPEQANMIKQ